MNFAGPHTIGLKTSIKAADGAIKGEVGVLYWLTISNTHAQEDASIEINDSTADDGTDKWAIVIPFGTTFACAFFPPIECSTGIYADITGGTVKLTAGYY